MIPTIPDGTSGTTESDSPKKAKNMFDEDITSVYELQLPAQRSHKTDFQVIELEVRTERQVQIVEKFEEHALVVEGKTALTLLVNDRIGDIGKHAATVFGEVVETAATVEAVTQAGSYRRGLRDFHAQLLTATGRHSLETFEIGVRTMQAAVAASVEPPRPPRPKNKGVFGAIGEFLFGEE